MGREIRRVPLDFDFPIGESYADADYAKHLDVCPHAADEDYEHEEKTCGRVYWSRSIPTGEGWQLWQTVSDGPVSPVFDTPEKLVDWMSQPVPVKDRPHYEPDPYPRMPWGQGWRRPAAEKFVEAAKRGHGWLPSMMIQGGRILSTEEMISSSPSEREDKT